MSRSKRNDLKLPAPLISTRRPLVPEFDPDGLCLLESLHALDFRMDWTRHPFLKIITVLRGSGVVEAKSGGRLIRNALSAGRVLAIFPDTLHRLLDDSGEPMLLYILCVESRFPFSIEAPARTGIHLVEDPAQAGRALQTLREIASLSTKEQARTTGNRLLRCGLTATLLGRLLKAAPAGKPAGDPPDSALRMRGFLSRLRQDFFLPRTIDQAAAELRMSRRRFTQLFGQLAGESYLQHIQRLRMEHACRLLKERKISPLTVAFQVGYEDASTFYRAFKKHTGLPPARWAG